MICFTSWVLGNTFEYMYKTHCNRYNLILAIIDLNWSVIVPGLQHEEDNLVDHVDDLPGHHPLYLHRLQHLLRMPGSLQIWGQ